MEFSYLDQDKYGNYILKNYKSQTDVDDYFENKYYQNETGSYNANYTAAEETFFELKMQEKEFIIQKYLKPKTEGYSLLDIGCGEGKTLSYFKKRGFDVTGIDYSSYAIKTMHPEVLSDLIQGDCKRILPELVQQNKKYDVICTDMMLDMTTNPEVIINECKRLIKEDGIFWINVSNNYSVLQMKLLEDGILKRDYWLDKEGHPTYFRTETLKKFGEDNGLECLGLYGESFIDFNLVNKATNYYENPMVGKDCYQARIYLESMLLNLSMEKSVEISRLLGEMGFGRTVTGIFKLKEKRD